jgi:hypothetical protein
MFEVVYQFELNPSKAPIVKNFHENILNIPILTPHSSSINISVVDCATTDLFLVVTLFIELLILLRHGYLALPVVQLRLTRCNVIL